MATTTTSMMMMSPAYAWLTVFLPALSYFLATRAGQSGWTWGASTLGTPVTGLVELWIVSSSSGLEDQNFLMERACQILSKTLYLAAAISSSSSPSACRDVVMAYQKRSIAVDVTSELPLTLPLKYALYEVYHYHHHHHPATTPSVDTGLMIKEHSGEPAEPRMVSMTWRHDTALGRGYLLWSDAAQDGRIWRWEVGGGPLAVGRTLHLDQAGCRSPYYRTCCHHHHQHHSIRVNHTTTTRSSVDERYRTGSGGLAIDFGGKEHWAEGRLVVAEWGEGRIVRLEENGARTPLVLEIPRGRPCARRTMDTDQIPQDAKSHDMANPAAQSSDENSEMETREALTDSDTVPRGKRVGESHSLLYTPAGDLLWVDTIDEAPGQQAAIWQLAGAIHMEPLPSMAASREAHAWTSLPLNHTSTTTGGKNRSRKPLVPRPLFQDDRVERIGGMALLPSLQDMVITAQFQDQSVVLMSIPLPRSDDDGDGEEDDDDKDATEENPPQSAAPHIVLNLTEVLNIPHEAIFRQKPGPIAISQQGVIWVGTDLGVYILETSKAPGSSDLKSSRLGVRPIGKLHLPSGAYPTALTMGGDGFLYIATSQNSLLRIRTQVKPVSFPVKA